MISIRSYFSFCGIES